MSRSSAAVGRWRAGYGSVGEAAVGAGIAQSAGKRDGGAARGWLDGGTHVGRGSSSAQASGGSAGEARLQLVRGCLHLPSAQSNQ
jgi:hypothetical protein